MRISTLLISASLSLVMTSCSNSQTPSATATSKEAVPAAQVHGNLSQVMRGILFPNSNVIFAGQNTNPADLKPDKDPSTATDPLLSTYGGWTAVENSGIALAEAANLLSLPGRKCSNGRDVPMKNPDWPLLVQGLHDAGMKAYEAGKSKNQDKLVDAADSMTTACANCHDKYRDKPGGDAERCM
jgi:hypothetical protein